MIQLSVNKTKRTGLLATNRARFPGGFDFEIIFHPGATTTKQNMFKDLFIVESALSLSC